MQGKLCSMSPLAAMLAAVALGATVAFFNLVTDLDLEQEEKGALVAFMRCL